MEYVFSFGTNGQENNAKDKKSNGFFWAVSSDDWDQKSLIMAFLGFK